MQGMRVHTPYAGRLALFTLLALAAPACAQGNPSSATNPFYGSITLRPATDETIKLSLDGAINMGLQNNLGLKEAESGEKLLHGEKNEAVQEFLPTFMVQARPASTSTTLPLSASAPALSAASVPCFPMASFRPCHTSPATP